VLNGADAELMARTKGVPRRVLFNHGAGWHVDDGWIMDGSVQVLAVADVPLLGAHNLANVCAALATIEAAGYDARALAAGVATFRPLPHRLQVLGDRNGIRYVNDSIATTPAATVEALRALAPAPIALLLGGFDRRIDWSPFLAAIAELAPHAVIGMGAHGEKLVGLLHSHGYEAGRLHTRSDLAAAVAHAGSLLTDTGTVLLSPGAPSFDAFRDYRERGERFAELAGFDPADLGQIEGLGIR
jgi:UDP-N-acetylmuramoylalanine--D-glutamate ligase